MKELPIINPKINPDNNNKIPKKGPRLNDKSPEANDRLHFSG